MKKTLYYVVEKQLSDVGNDIQEANGWKNVTVYSIVDNKPEKQFDLELSNSDNTEEEIQNYLNDNGMGDDEFEMKQL
jgi:hypothetical protein